MNNGNEENILKLSQGLQDKKQPSSRKTWEKRYQAEGTVSTKALRRERGCHV